MQKPRVAFQGTYGAYSEVALSKMLPDAEAVPCASFEDVFAALGEKQVEYALIPAENSIAGRVADVHHLLPRANVFIVGEHYEPIRHHLLAPEGATLETIKEVHSHVHALGQCRDFISRHGYRPVVHADTAGAAEDVAKWNDTAKAAIASELAGKRYGLQSIEAGVEDGEGNTTRFLLLSREMNMPPMGKDVITTILFTLRSVPAALYKATGGFATAGINLTKIESYVSGERFSLAQFYVDVEGHPEEKNMQHALEELKFYSDSIKILGVYPAHPARRG